MHIVAAGDDVVCDFWCRTLQAGSAGEGGSFVDDGLHWLKVGQVELLPALGDDGLFYFLGAALTGADDEGQEPLLACKLATVEDELRGLGGAAFKRHHRLG